MPASASSTCRTRAHVVTSRVSGVVLLPSLRSRGACRCPRPVAGFRSQLLIEGRGTVFETIRTQGTMGEAPNLRARGSDLPVCAI